MTNKLIEIHSTIYKMIANYNFDNFRLLFIKYKNFRRYISEYLFNIGMRYHVSYYIFLLCSNISNSFNISFDKSSYKEIYPLHLAEKLSIAALKWYRLSIFIDSTNARPWFNLADLTDNKNQKLSYLDLTAKLDTNFFPHVILKKFLIFKEGNDQCNMKNILEIISDLNLSFGEFNEDIALQFRTNNMIGDSINYFELSLLADHYSSPEFIYENDSTLFFNILNNKLISFMTSIVISL